MRKATFIIASVLNEAGGGICSTIISKSTLHTRRQLLRAIRSDRIHKNYSAVRSVVHWDGKLLPDIVGSGSSTLSVDRLAILLTNLIDNVSTKLLGVPKLPSGIGRAAAAAVTDCSEYWPSLWCVYTLRDIVGTPTTLVGLQTPYDGSSPLRHIFFFLEFIRLAARCVGIKVVAAIRQPRAKFILYMECFI